MGTLPKKFLPHKLSGQYKDNWECHIKPDWLLIWNIDDQANEIWLVRTGTHSDLF
jgi:mRNA interferase YafQ